MGMSYWGRRRFLVSLSASTLALLALPVAKIGGILTAWARTVESAVNLYTNGVVSISPANPNASLPGMKGVALNLQSELNLAFPPS